MSGMCGDCIYYKPDGWSLFRVAATGEPIPQGPCWQHSYYTHEAAMRVCGGSSKATSTSARLKSPQGDEVEATDHSASLKPNNNTSEGQE